MIATADSWKHQPFGSGSPIPYRAVFGADDYARICRGLIPEAMEDKWFIYFDDPYLFLHRSWTGQPVFRVAFDPDGEGARVREALRSDDIGDGDGPEYQAALLDFLIGNLMLGRDAPFPVPPGQREPAPGAYQHHIAGTGYVQAESDRRRAWWAFWRR
jgi:hypothetical protein